jgi:fucose permease/uncharacterized membrane protein YhaH (DUF805 family)
MRTLPIFLAFFLMGLADAMGPNADRVKNAYQISNVMSTMLPFVVFIAFAVFSVPGGLLGARIGKKKLLMLGLGINALALVIPSFLAPSFLVLLACIFSLGVGTTFLQVAGNPIMRDVSAEGAYSRNLAFAQGIKGIGSTASAYLVTAITTLALFKGLDWRGAFPPFCILMALAFVAVAFVNVKETKADVPPSIGSSVRLLSEPIFLLAVVGIFLYVGAESSMGRFLKPTLMDFGLGEQTANKFGPVLFFLMLTTGRLLGSALLSIMTRRTCFRLSALLGVLGAGAIMTGWRPLAMLGILVAGLGFANIWPLLFSITVEEKPECANELSGLMCMAISGGAIVPLLMGWLLDLNLGVIAFAVPALCFAYLLVLSLLKIWKPEKELHLPEGLFFSFGGRVPRRIFWAIVAVQGFVSLLIGFVSGMLINVSGVTGILGWLLYLCWLIMGTWIALASQVKRWHDRGRSGYMVLINLIPVVGWIWSLVELGLLPGTAGPNKYGSDPLELVQPPNKQGLEQPGRVAET